MVAPSSAPWPTVRELADTGRFPIPLFAVEELIEAGVIAGWDEKVCPPKIMTPSPERNVVGAWFDVAAVVHVVAAMAELRHVEGRWANRPLIPEAWQVLFGIAPVFGWKHSLDHAYDDPDTPDPGARIINTWAEFVPRKNGKSLDVETPVPTPSGWTTMGQLEPGDEVLGRDGRPTTVTYVSPVMHDHDCYELTFSDGTSIVADAEHLWTVWDAWGHGPTGTERTVTTAEMAAANIERWRMLRRAPLELPEVDLPLDPWLLGAWLGDGSTGTGQLTVGFDDMEWTRSRIEQSGWSIRSERRRSDRGPFRVNVDGLSTRLREIGVREQKRIPAEYLRASHEQRLALLQGLLDTDGTVFGGRTVELALSDPDLAADAAELIRSLGIRLRPIRTRNTSGRDSIRLGFVTDLPVFAMPRKAERLAAAPSAGRRYTIKSIEPVPSVPVRCIAVDNDEHLFLAGEGMQPTHNTTSAAGMILVLLGFDGEAAPQVYSLAKDKNQASLAFKPAKRMAMKSPAVAEEIVPLKAILEVPSSGGFYQVIASVADAAHGFNPHGTLIDEVHVIGDGEIYEVIRTGLGARSQPIIMLKSTADDGAEGSLFDDIVTKMISLEAGDAEPEPAFFGAMWAAEENADPFDELTWWQANPNLGISKQLTYMRNQAKDARNRPSAMASFLRLELNLREGGGDGAWNMIRYGENGSHVVDRQQLAARDDLIWVGGLCVSSTTDLCSWVLVARDKFGESDTSGWWVMARHWLPADALGETRKKQALRFRGWARDGWLQLTPGDVRDPEVILSDISADLRDFSPVAFGYVPWESEEIRQAIDEGSDSYRVNQTITTLAEPTREIEDAIEKLAFGHGGDPVLRWQMANTRPHADNEGRWKPSPKHSVDTIPAVRALVTAVATALDPEVARPRNHGSASTGDTSDDVFRPARRLTV